MARPKKQTIDYFPHSCTHGKTMFIIEQKYGNDGYAFWFKLLELLGDTAGHYIDLNDGATQEFLQAKTMISWGLCHEILDLLAKLGAIDAELWENKVVWSQNYVDGISDVYKNRRTEIPSRPSFYIEKPHDADISTGENPQSKVKESKVKESKDTCASGAAQESKCTPKGDGVEASDEVAATLDEQKARSGPRSPFNSKRQEQLFDRFWAQYPKKRSKGQAEKTWVKLKPDEQLFEAIMAGLERAKTSVEWLRDDGQYIPYPSTWLNAKGWEDEYPQQGGGTSGGNHANRGNTQKQYAGEEPNAGFKKFRLTNTGS